MRNPQFARKGIVGNVALAAANTASDGSGTIGILLTGRLKTFPVTRSGNVLTVSNWSQVSNIEWMQEFVGDIVTFVSGTPPTGASNNTEYRISKLSINSVADTASFELLDPSTNTLVSLSSDGTNPVMAFNLGTRVERVRFISAQASAAASSAMVGRLFVRDNVGGSWRLLDEVALPTITRSNTVVGQKQDIVLPSGFVLPGGHQLGVTISVYAGAQDQYHVHALNAAAF